MKSNRNSNRIGGSDEIPVALLLEIDLIICLNSSVVDVGELKVVI